MSGAITHCKGRGGEGRKGGDVLGPYHLDRRGNHYRWGEGNSSSYQLKSASPVPYPVLSLKSFGGCRTALAERRCSG